MQFTNQRFNLPENVKNENAIFSLICQLERQLEQMDMERKNCEFIATVVFTKVFLKKLKRFF